MLQEEMVGIKQMDVWQLFRQAVRNTRFGLANMCLPRLCYFEKLGILGIVDYV